MKKALAGLFILFSTIVYAKPATDTLYVYGPGGPQEPVNECAQIFGRKNSIAIKVTAGPDKKWLPEAEAHADVFFGGAEYMLTQFTAEHPELVDAASRTELYKRAAGILVKPGNPKKIKSLRDLASPGIRILDVNGAGQMGLWEDMAGKQNLISGIQRNIKSSFANSALGIEAWKKDTQYDAWITYASWHIRLPKETQLVEVPATETVYRGTPVALSKTTHQKEKALAFIRFMQSAEGHAVFKKWGWE